MHVIRIISIFILFSFINFNSYSSEIFSKGSGTVQVKNVKKIKPEESELAKKKAVESAWKKYTGKFDVSKMKQYMLIEEDINLDDYINDVQVLDNVVVCLIRPDLVHLKGFLKRSSQKFPLR